VVVSRGLRDALPTDVEHDMVRIIPCGIDLDRFRPLDRHACCARLGWDPDRFHVLFPANAGNRVKRPDLAEAAVRVAGGDGIPVELHYLRGVANIDVPTWVNASDVLLLTSLHEGSPTVVKEALACTVPVVSVDVGDVAERIADIEGCHLCDADPHHLARGLRAVHEAGQRLRETGDVQALSLERIAQRLACFYEEVRGDFDGQPTDVMTGRRLRVKESPGRTGSLTDA
jgi:glycosyltransferase involved in cell wall biosynthesis